ncbi:MAG: hypothetical protein QW607_01905 [Desulfurococcaceae archaeon]
MGNLNPNSNLNSNKDEEIWIKIEVPREKASEIYRFTDWYLEPKRFMTWSEYQKLIDLWHKRFIDLIFYNYCDFIEDLTGEEIDECPFDIEKMRDELFEVLENNEEIKKLEEELGLTWMDIEPMDYDFHVDGIIEISPVIKFDRDGYKIYLIVEKLPDDPENNDQEDP